MVNGAGDLSVGLLLSGDLRAALFRDECLLSWLAMQVPLGLTVAYVLFKAGRRGDPSENEVDAKRDESGTLAPTVMNADAA